MQMTIRISARQMKAIKRKFGSMKSLTWLRRPIKDSMYYMLSSIEKNFAREGRPTKWAPWSQGYRESVREKVGAPFKILQLAGVIKPTGGRTGGRTFALQLKRSISVGKKLKKDGWFIGTNLKYAALHQFGGYVGPYKNIYVPKRPYLLYQKQDILLIQRMFQAHINRVAGIGA